MTQDQILHCRRCGNIATSELLAGRCKDSDPTCGMVALFQKYCAPQPEDSPLVSATRDILKFQG